MPADSLKERSIFINVVDSKDQFVQGATVEIIVGTETTTLDNLTQPAVFHLNDMDTPVRLIARYGSHKDKATLAPGQFQYTLRLNKLVLPTRGPTPPVISTTAVHQVRVLCRYHGVFWFIG